MLYQPNDTLGQIITALDTITGSTFITLLLITILIMILFLGLSQPFGWPLEYSIIIILPLHIAILAYISNWMAIVGSFLIYLGIIFAKNLLHR